jgi:menaquinol-cytochrome c reductase iron-sulfur subunit
MISDQTSPSTSHSPPPDRRSFVTAAAALATGALAMLAPVGAGIATFLSPLFRRSKPAEVRVALLDQTPDDGVPRFFPVLADRVDAWSRRPAERIGAVYLVRSKGEPAPVAFTAKCPHAGCFIGYAPGATEFKCPCHTSAFKLDGQRVNGDREVAPRDMDKLAVEVREARAPGGTTVSEVWVKFVDFETGRKEQIPTA